MSLFEEALEECVLIDKVTTNTNDGYGGVQTVYVNGATFQAAFAFDDSSPARIAAQNGYVDRHTVYTPKDVELREGDYFKRLKDDKIYEATSSAKDMETPSSAWMEMRAVSAKQVKELPGYG